VTYTPYTPSPLSTEMQETLHDWFEIPGKENLFAVVAEWLTEHDRQVAEATQELVEKIANHVAAEYEDDPHLDSMVLQLRAAHRTPQPTDCHKGTYVTDDSNVTCGTCGQRIPNATVKPTEGEQA
jgi:hypothetical protein